jgi:hypothetical protein
MALSDTQKHAVVAYLGYSGKTLVADSTDYNRSVVTALTGLNSYIEAQVDDFLTQLDAVQLKIAASTARMMAKKVGDIELVDDELGKLRRAKSMYLRDLSKLIGIPVIGGSSVNMNVVV